MRKFLLLAAVLALVPTAAPAATEWEANFRRCEIDKWFTRGEDAYEFNAEGRILVTITPKDIVAIERGTAVLKRCSKFWACVRDRDAGRRKHCYLPRRRSERRN
jgi:hypothetical protein